MLQDRKEYRKSFNSPGQIYVGGELLDFISYDVSVKGILIEIVPSAFLSEVSDFEALIKQNNVAEIYIKDLQMSGETEIVWAKLDVGKIMLGLEFKDVQHNAEKLWIKRKSYRSQKIFSGHLIIDDKQLDFNGLNVSVDGLAIALDLIESELQPERIIKLVLDGLDVKAVGKIVWVNTTDEGTSTLGIRYLTVI